MTDEYYPKSLGNMGRWFHYRLKEKIFAVIVIHTNAQRRENTRKWENNIRDKL